MTRERLELRFKELAGILTADYNQEGYWQGQLSLSALGVAVAIAALHFNDAQANYSEIQLGLDWLHNNINADGSYGDTPESTGNISTSLLVYAALNLYSENNPLTKQVQGKISDYFLRNNIDVNSDKVVDHILGHYKKDYTFSVPILTMCALCNIPSSRAFDKIPQLPFELALLPQKFYRLLNLSVVSYAIPALIAVGIVIFKKKKTNRINQWVKRKLEKKALNILQKSMPESGGFLEAIPLTAFVSLSLINAGYGNNAVVKKGIAFLKRTQRSDGGWPIDIDLSTWVTTLSVKALGVKKDEVLTVVQKDGIIKHLKSIQNKVVHPFNGALPGGWGWTNYPGSVPDGDDTPGAILALLNIAPPTTIKEEVLAAGEWLLKLQNNDGGFPTFSKGWGKLPFDQSCADLTGHCILALTKIMYHYNEELPEWYNTKIRSSLKKALSYLKKQQQDDGAWLPLWFGNQQTKNHANPVYGTARVATYLNDALLFLKSHAGLELQMKPLIEKSQSFLLRAQNNDGSWGGDKNIQGTIEETSLSVSALMGDEFMSVKQKAFAWLDKTYKSQGLKPAPIGLYFALLWYDEKMYPLTLYIEALVRNLTDDKP